MSEAAIIVKDVSKKYRLFDSARDRLKEALHPFSKHYHREFWALKGVNFEVPRGQTVGILGRNGSGKSTLLQIIAGIMQPTSGEVIVNGRVSALLELGAGFNPEFTGRENVLFQAQVMGLSREEINRRLPEIEAFADVGEFFDQPVKTYSSGMFVRVAFASAVNVDPHILIVDEALSVGDAKFQHKCFQTFRRFLDAGKTLVIVSHDVSTLLRLCDSGIVLEGGEIHFSGVISQATNCYQELLFGKGARRIDDGDSGVVRNKMAASRSATKSTSANAEQLSESNVGNMPLDCDGTSDHCSQRPSYNKSEARLGDGRALILDYAVVADGQLEPPTIPFNANLSIYLKIRFMEDVDNVSVGFAITSKEGVYVYGTNLYMQGKALLRGLAGEILLAKFTWRPMLVGGDYFLNLGCNQITPQQDLFLDVRRSVAHLRFADTQWCTGFVATQSSLEELDRFSVGDTS
jgi:lipopolysaccharide transport system ATP-binding protein